MSYRELQPCYKLSGISYEAYFMDDVPGVTSLNLFNFSSNLKVKCLMFFSPEKNQPKIHF
jgi:hypothetical protein